MKRVILLLLCIFYLSALFCNAEIISYTENSKFGLKDTQGNIITKAKYKKLIRLGESGWIMQDGTKFGIINDAGEVVIKPKYNKAERILGKMAKFTLGDKCGIFDENGDIILPIEYSSIDLLYGGMFVTAKNYKYGITDLKGNQILENIFDDIYMPNFNTLVIVYNGKQIEIERKKEEGLSIPKELEVIQTEDSWFTDITSKPIESTGYYGITATDYLLKLFSSISPSYEQTIDELIFSQGADTVSVLMKFSWIPKFPIVYVKKYFENIMSPNTGPLHKYKRDFKQKIKTN